MSIDIHAEVPRSQLRRAAICCLAIWAAIWFLFLAIRFSSFDIRIIPGVGPVMLLLLVAALGAPVIATGLAVASLVRQPGTGLNWLTLGCSIAAIGGQVVLFTINRWQ